eukprot:TRINITY_DN5072_c0_g2_i2.p1 TRINITY_DN5072_c0_g2~~TRINITY_DN5072_c0_g2_i2.p1  ORF type:complete len:402 (-),score=79.18 TRINITY_DN5072_c0_g2_i2:106-1311(-)
MCDPSESIVNITEFEAVAESKEEAKKRTSELLPEGEELKIDEVFILDDGILWSEITESAKSIKPSLAEKIAKWGTNFMYKMKLGNGLHIPFMGDKKLDRCKIAQLNTEVFLLNSEEGYKFFLKSFKSLIWMTYRANFHSLLDIFREYITEQKLSKLGTKLCTDNGWGCSIRAGQMALANALLRYFFDKGFSFSLLNKESIEGSLYEETISAFWDNGRGKAHPFSIQNFCEMALNYDKLPGEWLNQTAVAYVLRDLNLKYMPYDIDVVVCTNGIIYRNELIGNETLEDANDFEVIKEEDYDEFEKVNKKTDPGKIIFALCTLGMKTPSRQHLKRLQELFAFPQLVGLMGGRKNEALFFVGYQDDDLIFLDPHFVQVSLKNTVANGEEQAAVCRICNVPLQQP